DRLRGSSLVGGSPRGCPPAEPPTNEDPRKRSARRFDWPAGWNGRVSWARRSPCRSARSWQKGRRLTLITSLPPPRADALGWNVAGAADAKEPTAIRELREKEERSSQFRSATIDRRGH